MDGEAPWTATGWADFLAARLGAPVEVEFGRSRRYPIQVWTRQTGSGGRGRPRTWIVRLNREVFATAKAPVREDVAAWPGGKDEGAASRLDGWLHEQITRSETPPDPPVVETSGQQHDLLVLARPLLEHSFVGAFEGPPPAITWGRRVRSRGRRSLRLGSFDPGRSLVRVHPVLDQEAVPAWFVRYILFHELLHAALPPRRDGRGRWIHHPPEFRELELLYPDHQPALAWEALNVPRLIRSATQERPMRVLPRDRRALARDERWNPRACPRVVVDRAEKPAGGDSSRAAQPKAASPEAVPPDATPPPSSPIPAAESARKRPAARGELNGRGGPRAVQGELFA